MRHILLILTLLLAASAASAQVALTACDGNKTRTTLSNNVGAGTNICCEAGPTETGSCDFNIVAPQASICLDRDTATTDGAAVITIARCMPGSTPGANTCTPIVSVAADTCPDSYSRGLYRVTFTIAPAAGENAKVSVSGY